jgi:hypothetical protein
VALRRVLAKDNPAFVPDLALALNNLGIRYSEVGRAGEGDAAWEATLAALGSPQTSVELLIRRSSSRQSASQAVSDLTRGATLLGDDDYEMHGRLHGTARAIREEGQREFDAAWQAASGGLPGWLILDTAYLDLVGRWVVTKTYGEAAALAREHAQSLLEGPTELALEEIGLLLGDPAATAEEREILTEARERGFEAAYLPYVTAELVRSYLAADLDAQVQNLREHRGLLLSDASAEILEDLTYPDQPTHISGSALLTLARHGLERQAMVSLASTEARSELVDALVGPPDAEALLAFGQLLATVAVDEPAMATSLFYAALALVLGGESDRGAEALRDARRTHDETVQALVPTLVRLAALQPPLASLAAVLSEHLSPESSDGSA